jgi:hypothetical protein
VFNTSIWKVEKECQKRSQPITSVDGSYVASRALSRSETRLFAMQGNTREPVHVLATSDENTYMFEIDGRFRQLEHRQVGNTTVRLRALDDQ